VDWQLAHVKEGSIEAVQFLDRLMISAMTICPTPGYAARIVMGPLDIVPPEFMVQVASKFGIWPQKVTEIPASGNFNALPNVSEITVQTDEGPMRVPVRIVRGAPGSIAGAATGLADPNIATGYSESFTFDEAFHNAVAALPPDPLTNPDIIVHVRVLESGAITGGFIGFHAMYVTVRRDHSPIGPPITVETTTTTAPVNAGLTKPSA
jgi:hypothetical protein